MCLAIFKPMKAEFPSDSIMKRAWGNNPDGAGLAIVTENGVKIIKGLMTFEALKEKIESLDLYDFEVLIHFRWATSGPDNKPAGMTHPFPISRKNEELKALELICDRALIHNGVMFSPNLSDYSDTAIFSRYLSYFPNATSEQIKDCIPYGNKVAIATKNGVELFGNWTVKNGCHFSNEFSFETPAYYSNKSKFKKSKYEIDYDYFEKKNGKEEADFAFADSRRDDPYYYSETVDYSDFDFEEDHADLEYCPHCDSDNTEMIGIRTKTAECLDCGAVYNETDFLISPDYVSEKIQKIKTKVKAG